MFHRLGEYKMPNRIIEIATDNQKLSVFRGFLRIEKEGNVTDVPFNHISALMVTAHQVVYTHNLLQRLCEEGIPLVVLGKNLHTDGVQKGLREDCFWIFHQLIAGFFIICPDTSFHRSGRDLPCSNHRLRTISIRPFLNR